MVIEKLSEEIINQIAAGEVIENPAAIIKELIENSIDANATQIDINIKNFGLDKIQIKDNGFGISKKDLLKAPLRHATSKITSFNDLYNIDTMGFRGEALASIFSIAKTKIISKCENKNAYEISYNDLNLVKESAGENGTLIEVNDIFYNTPARKKYLKSKNLELKSIIDIINRFEVFYFNIKFSLRHNDKLIVNKPQFNTSINNLYYVLGKDLKNNLFEFKEEIKGIKISGFIGKPSSLTYSFRKNQYLYVNSRFIKSKLIRDAIYTGFTTNLMTNRHPFFVLFIEIDPQIIDVNIHPTKIEIKFENELEIFELIKNSIEKIFEKQESFKEFEPIKKEFNIDLSEKIEEISPNKSYRQLADSLPVKNYSKYYSNTNQKHFEIKENEIIYNKTPIETKKNDSSNEIDKLNEKGPLFTTLKDYKILGQLNKTYIIIQTPNEMLLVDQHVAEEKYYYEKFKKQFEEEKGGEIQYLLKSQIIHLTNSQMLLYNENSNILKSVGFETEFFGSNEIIVRGVPINIRNEIIHAQNLKDMLYDILINKKIKCVEEENYSRLASMACRISIMAGEELTLPQMKRIIENLKYLKQPFNCPHGRPTFLRYTYYELNKKFKRII